MGNKKFEKNENDVGLRILERVRQVEDNLVFSPLSIYMMLTLLAAAASQNAQIQRNLLSFLKFKSIPQLNSYLSTLFAAVFGDTSPNGGPSVATANAVWLAHDLPVKPSFQNLLHTLYNGKLHQVDFLNKLSEVVEEANTWVKEETRGLISNIFSNNNVYPTTRMILANIVYFKAQWSTQFHETLTKHQDFHLLNGSSVQVPFMSGNDHDIHAVSVFDTFKVAQLQYNSGNDESDDDDDHDDDPRHFSMRIFLPNDRDGLPALIERACSEVGFFDRYSPKCKVDVEEFKIPKFKFNTQFKLVEILESFGLGSLFSDGSGFTEMVEAPAGEELFISSMFHAAAISVNEKGTEAAGLTVCDMMSGCLETDPVKIKFVADHPFLFVITENVSGCVLFMGQVLDPSPN